MLAFLFADLIVLPIVLAYRKYYGGRSRAPDRRADVRDDGRSRRSPIDALFSALGLVPSGPRPIARRASSAAISVDYKLFLNILALAVFAGLFWLTRERVARPTPSAA